MRLKDWSNRLIWATILVTVVRYMAAFAASDVGIIEGFWSDVITFFLSLTGLGMGILDTVGGGLLFNGWSRVFPKNGQAWSLRFKILTLCVFTLVLSGLIILVPFTMSRLAHESVLDALGGKSNVWAWVWSTMVNLIPYVLVAGVFTGNKIVEGMETESYQKDEKVTRKVTDNGEKLSEKEESSEKVSSNLPTDWRKLRDMLSDPQIQFIANHDPKDIVKEFGRSGHVISPRNASNWRNYAREERPDLIQ